MNILILHGIDDVERARRTSINHAFFLAKYAPQHSYFFQGVNDPVPAAVSSGAFDVIMVDTTFLCWRWAKPRGEGFDRVLDRFAFVARSEAVKIAFPQDEYDHCALLDDWLVDWKIDVVGMPCFRHRSVLLPRTTAHAQMRFAMTGYLDHADLQLAERLGNPFAARTIDVGYRARRLSAAFGRLGRLKADIAPLFESSATGTGLVLDISTREADSIAGDAWLGFLGDCRFTLGTPSGSSLADPEGAIRAAVSAYAAEHPNADFDDIEQACFPGLDGRYEFSALSPRIFEAALTGTCQVLVEGDYLPGLNPGDHYISLARDFSNIDKVLASLRDDDRNMSRIRAMRDIVTGDTRLSYRGFAKEVLGWVADVLESRGIAVDREAVTATTDDDPAIRHARILDDLRSGTQSAPIPTRAPSPRVCLLSLSRIPDDPRVRRQGEALFDAGWTVAAVGQPGARSKRPPWPSYHAGHLQQASAPIGTPPVAVDAARAGTEGPMLADAGVSPLRALVRRHLSVETKTLLMRAIVMPTLRFRSRAGLAVRSQLARLAPEAALKVYWSWSSIQELYAVSKGIDADLWVANDWLMLPLAARLAEERGGVFVYDTHEFAVNEYMERLKWRLFNRPLVKAIEQKYIKQAKVVSTVSQGIADGLQQVYRLSSTPMLIRNTPLYQSVQPAPETDRIRVLYHGIVASVRGLEPLIRSVKHWRPDFDLTIRGPGNDDYLQGLRALIASEGVSDRVTLAPPVPMTALVQEAAAFDVGFFCMPRLSQQHEYVLPNKLFEYIMAGLAICVSDLPEMSRIVRATEVGVLLPSADPMDIAKVMNGLTREAIRSYKVRSLEVARDLCWEQESKALLAAYAQAIGRA